MVGLKLWKGLELNAHRVRQSFCFNYNLRLLWQANIVVSQACVRRACSKASFDHNLHLVWHAYIVVLKVWLQLQQQPQSDRLIIAM